MEVNQLSFSLTYALDTESGKSLEALMKNPFTKALCAAKPIIQINLIYDLLYRFCHDNGIPLSVSQDTPHRTLHTGSHPSKKQF